MNLLVGLGNPGSRYAGNRHNIGFMVLDEIHRRYSFAKYRKKFEGEFAEGEIEGPKVFLLKPSTFMNDSGKSVGAFAQFYKVPPSKIVVLHDEIDLAPGKVRVKEGGGLAGHNGLKSIAQNVGIDFKRVRIGIGHPGEKNLVSGHVLRDFSKSDRDWVMQTIDVIAGAVPSLLAGEDAKFMNIVALANESARREEKRLKCDLIRNNQEN